MCQARTSVYFSSVLIWKLLTSLTFGFCSIWSLHFVAMLARELDVPIDIDVPLTILSSVLAVFFTFAALTFDLLWDRFRQGSWQRRQLRKRERSMMASTGGTGSSLWTGGAKPYSESFEQEEGENSEDEEASEHAELLQDHSPDVDLDLPYRTTSELDSPTISAYPAARSDTVQEWPPRSPTVSNTETSKPSCNCSDSRRDSRRPSLMGSMQSSHGMANIMNFAHRSTAPAKNAFVTTGEALYTGCTRRNIIKAFLWSLAVSGMHYVGIAALRIPDGHYKLNPPLVVLSGLISWVVCLVGVILMLRIETNLAQQILFSVVASTGVAAMHFTGKSVFCSRYNLY